MRQLNPNNSNWNKFCESCRPLSQHHSPANSSQKKRDSSAISPLANEAKKTSAVSFEEIDMEFLKTLSREDMLEEIEAVFKAETVRKARMLADLNSMKSLIMAQKEEINKLKVAFADREVERYYGNNSSRPSTLPAQANPNVKSYAQAAKKTL